MRFLRQGHVEEVIATGLLVGWNTPGRAGSCSARAWATERPSNAGRQGTQSRTTVHRVPVGTLVVDMYDNKTHQLVWRGKSTEQLSNKSGKNISKLKGDIDHMLNGFPPQYKS